MANALSRGVDGLMLMGCKSGDDYQCHFIKGSELAQKRLENIQETLDRLMLESERVNVSEVEITDYDQIPDKVRQFHGRDKGDGPPIHSRDSRRGEMAASGQPLSFIDAGRGVVEGRGQLWRPFARQLLPMWYMLGSLPPHTGGACLPEEGDDLVPMGP